MPDCRVIPCYKKFLNELDDIMSSGHFSLNSSSPIETIDFDGSISPRPQHFHIATETTPNRAQFRFSDSRKESSAHLNPSKVLRRQVVSWRTLCEFHRPKKNTLIISVHT